MPTIAAELWGVPLDQVLGQIRAGALAARVDHGFVVVDVAEGLDHIAPGPPRSEPPPTTFAPAYAHAPAELSTSAVLTEAERAALGGPLELSDGWRSRADDEDDDDRPAAAAEPTATEEPSADHFAMAVESVDPVPTTTCSAEDARADFASAVDASPVEAVAAVDLASAGLMPAATDLGGASASSSRPFPSDPPTVDLMDDELAALASCAPPAPVRSAAAEVPTPGDESPRPTRRRGRFGLRKPAPAPLPTPAAVEEDEMGPDPNDGEPDDGKPLDWRNARAKAATRRRPPPGRF